MITTTDFFLKTILCLSLYFMIATPLLGAQNELLTPPVFDEEPKSDFRHGLLLGLSQTPTRWKGDALSDRTIPFSILRLGYLLRWPQWQVEGGLFLPMSQEKDNFFQWEKHPFPIP